MSSEPASVPATLFYFQTPADGSRPYQHTEPDPVTGIRQQNFGRTEEVMQIENLRGREDSVSLDKNGFQFFRHPAKHTTFANDQEIQDEYYPESAEFIKQVTGASRVVFFDHSASYTFLIRYHILTTVTAIRRNYAEKVEDSPNKRKPVQGVHVDQTPAAAAARVHRHLPAEEVDGLLAKRFQIINLWRPIHHAAYDFPLALCDYSTVDAHKDLVPVILRYPDRDGETFGVLHNPAHGWKYVRGLTPEEGVLIKW